MILEMLSEGKIDQEEALKLLEALGEEQNFEEDKELVRGLEKFVEASDKLNQNNREEIEKLERLVEENEYFEKDLNWVHIDAFAGDIEVRVDNTLNAPLINDGENYKLKEKNKNFFIFHKKLAKNKASKSIIDEIGNFVSNLGNDLGENLTLTIPAGYGLRINSKAGNVELSDVPFVYIRCFAGNIELKDIGGVDLDSKAGDVEISMRATQYKNKIKASAGNINLKLKNGSSVNLKAKVGVGNMSHNLSSELENYSFKEGLTAAKLAATIGNGDADFDIKLGAGNLDLVLEND